jgi:hypothetical protein
MKTKKIKAKRYWKTSSGTFLHPDKKSAQYFSGFNAAEVAPVVVLPADLVSVKAMIAQGAQAIAEYNTAPGKQVMIISCDVAIARMVLAAIGVR